MDYPFSIEKLHDYFKEEPKTKYVVHALYEKGFQPKTIADWLNLNASSVSYHLSKPLKYPYINQKLRQDIIWFDEAVEESMRKNKL
jgi:predicted transcriptional regulator